MIIYLHIFIQIDFYCQTRYLFCHLLFQFEYALYCFIFHESICELCNGTNFPMVMTFKLVRDCFLPFLQIYNTMSNIFTIVYSDTVIRVAFSMGATNSNFKFKCRQIWGQIDPESLGFVLRLFLFFSCGRCLRLCRRE